MDICTEIQGFLHSRHADMPLGEMSLGGSLLDDLQVHDAPRVRTFWVFFSMVDGLGGIVSVLCAGGQRRPRVSAGASAAGSVAVASRPR